MFVRRLVRLSIVAVVVCLIGLATVVAAAAEPGWTGVVRDSSGAVVPRARVVLMTAEQAVIAATQTDERGSFTIGAGQRGRLLLVVSAPGFSEVRVVATSTDTPMTITLSLEPVKDEVTVTASRGLVQEAAGAGQAVSVIGADDIASRAKEVVGQAVAEEAGVHLLRTSPTMAGIYVRGLTGNKVNIFVDGVRYSTSAMRGGVNTFLDLIEPSALQAVEVLHGPNSAQYGSDALGGSVQFLTRPPEFGGVGANAGIHGLFSASAGTASANGGGAVGLGYSANRFGLFANMTGRRVGDIRTGGGVDSHAAVTRFLGVSSDTLMSSHLPETGFSQYGGLLRLNWAPTANQQVMVSYSRSQQDDGKRYDQLLGGDGNLQADLRNLMLDFFYVRYQRVQVGWFDQVTATYSFNSQREERVNQGGNGNPKNSVTHEFERTNVHGFQANARKQFSAAHSLLIGGEFYPERIAAPSYSFAPTTGVTAVRRGRVPDQAGYKSGAAYVEDQFEPVAGVLRVHASVRYSGASYESLAADSPLVSGKPLWPDDSYSTSNLTFRAGVVIKPHVDGLTLTANVSRGFRAPHVTDLGTAGLTGSGFQVTESAIQGMGATIGTTASSSAVSTGRAVEQVKPETSLNYEGGMHFARKGLSTSLFAFVNDVYDNVAYQALILPQGAVGKTLGDQAITSQNANGVVFVPASSTPVLVRTNFGDARIYGIEHRLDWRVSRTWSVGTVFTYLHAADKDTGLAPNIEGGTPAPDGYVKVRYLAASGRWWVEPYLHAAAEQSRLSTLDLEDRRTGGMRTRSSIKSFFSNGATARGWVGPGTDGTMGTADDILLVTGETVAQVQSRVLGSADSSALFTAVPAYVTVGIRGSVRVGTHSDVSVDFENVGDKSYRGIAWGIDAPGRNLTVSWRTRF
jgi:hemoglobin/transferrin/lactoferrin receptor protein